MKAFSFLTILESLSKKLSILRTKMHSDDFRVDYESITSQLRVNPLFSRTSFGASFADLSRRASHFAAILTILFTIGVGSVWGVDYVIYQATSGGVNTSNVEKTEISFAFNNMKGVTNSPVTSVKSDTYGIEAGLKAPRFGGSSNGNNIKFVVKNGYIATVTAYVQANSDNQNIAIKTSDASPSNTDLAYASCKKDVVYKIEATNLSAGEYYIKSSSDKIGLIKLVATVSGDETISVTGVSLNKTSTTLEIGDTETLTATVAPASATNKNVSWTSSNTSIATVQNGVVTAVAAGTATITVTTEDGSKTATCAVTVNAAAVTPEPSGGCETHVWYNGGAPSSATQATCFTFTKAPSGTNTTSSSMTIGDKTYTHTTRSGDWNSTITFIIQQGKIGAFYIHAKGTRSRTVTLKNASITKTFNMGTSFNTFSVEDLTEGTWTMTVSGNIHIAMLGLYECPSTFSVTYDSNGATSGSAPTDDEDYENGATVTVKSNTGSLAKTGYTFDGWNTKADGTGTPYAANATFTISANTTLYAQWNVNSYTLTWNVNGGNALTGTYTSGNVNYGAAITKPADPTRTGYTFAGWHNGTSIVTPATTMPANALTYTAQWTAKQYNITYKDQGNADFSGTHGANYPTKHTYGTATTLVEPTKANYEFGGWYTNAECTGSAVTSLGATTYTAAITLYAKWNCTAPTSVSVSGSWDRFGGETISLTATATGGSGNYTYQWQKKIGDNWTNITDNTTATTANLVYENCDGGNSGSYQCVVSTGTDCSTTSNALQVKVYTLECYNTTPTTVHHFTRIGNTQSGSLTLNLEANTAYKFKVHVDNTYYGNNGTINKDETNWVMCNSDNGGDCANNLTVNSGLGGTFTFGIEYSTSGNSSVEGEPEISVTYPRKTIYLNPGDWNTAGAKYAIYYFIDGHNAWSDFFVGDACGTYTTIPQWNGVTMIAVRLSSDANEGTWDKKWNQTGNILVNNNDYIEITGWGDNGDSPYTYSTYTPPTYSITFNGNGNTGGSMTNVTGITCGEDRTLAQNAYTRTGYTFAGWSTSPNGDKAYDDKATISNITSNITLHAKWTVNSYTVTWNPAGGNWAGNTDNIVQTYEYGAEIQAPEKPSRTGYEFVEWDPTYAAGTTMPAEDVTYTAQWREIAQTYNITYYLGPEDWNDDNPLPTYTEGTAHTLPTKDNITEENGGEFGGWYENNTFTGEAVTTIPADATGDKTYYAKWVYDIKFFEVVNEAEDVQNKAFIKQLSGNYAPTTYVYGKGITLPELPAKDGYTAAGWYSQWCVYHEQTNGLGWVEACKSTALADDAYGNVNFAVKYTANTYTITWNANGGNVSPESSTYTYGGSTVTLPTPTWDGHTFNGWFTEETGGTQITEIGTTNKPTSDVIYYAQWTENTPVTPEPEPEGDYCINLGLGEAPTTANGGIPSGLNNVTITLTSTGDKSTWNDGYLNLGANDDYITFDFTNVGKITKVSFDVTIPNWAADKNKIEYKFNDAAKYTEKTISSAAKEIITLEAPENTNKFTFSREAGTGTRISQICFTLAPTTPTPEPGDCEDLVNTSAKTSTELNTTIGNATLSNPGTGNSSAIKLNSSGYIELSPKTGYSFEEGDKLFVTIYNQASGNKTTGFKIGTNEYTVEINGKSNYTFEQTLTAANIIDGKVKIMRHSSDGWFVSIIIQRCAALPSCTTPVLSNLENKKVCPGSDVTWTASNTATLQGDETIAYQWNKKGNNTVLSSTTTLTLDNVTEAAGGTYVVTATVSADGKASKTASKEVTLTVIPATATPTITASASTVYAGNNVTLTASCASSGVSYQWYTCTDAEGNGESAIGDATNATYTLTAGDAGTYYYKVIVTGDGTNSCGTAEKVYTLIVSAAIDASDCTTYFWFPYAQDATTNSVTNNENNFFGNSPKTGQNNTGTYKFKLDDITYTATRNTADAKFTITFVIPDNSIGTMALNCKGSSSSPLYLKHTDNTEILVSNLSSYKSFVIEDITPGTWTLQSSGNWTLSGMAVKVCSGSDCTDPQVTATVNNATICEGTENVTFTATNYADGATFQWQKKDGNTWTNINGATSDTYTIPSVATAHAGQYRVIAEKGCKRISEEVTLTVLTAPTFNTFATTASVMKGNALAISDVQATGATGYAWYKSTDNSFNAAEDTKVGTSKDLLLAAASITETADQSFYLFCVASNSCGSVTSNAITVTVTPFVEEECATKGNEGDQFGFTNTSCSSDTYGDSKTPVWKTNSRDKYLTYTAPEGKYFATAKVTVAHTGGTECGYAYSTNRGTTWEVAELDGLSTTLTAITIDDLPENVNAFRISRNLTAQDGKEKGSDSGNFYLAEACFTYKNACTETTLTVGSYEDAYNMSAQMDFVEPTFTLKAGETTTLEGQTLTYTSSNTAIATVDEDGNVTFEGMTGTVTITATFAGGTIGSTEYCACQGSYTITVDCDDEAPKIITADEPNLNGCYNSITLEAKMQNGTTPFADGTFQWFRNGVAIDGATNASYEVVRAGTYTVSRTYTCTTMSSNSAVVTNENVEPEVERLTPFQYYHVDKTYSNQMKNRHLFAVTSYGILDGKRYHLTATRNDETLDLSSSTAFFTIPSSDNAVDTVMIDLNELKGKYSANDEIVITCAPINNCNTASAITASITIHVIDQTPTLALICSGADGEGTRATEELVVGGDFLTGYNKADLCQQTSNTTFDPNTEWGFYTELQKNYIVTPVNGYAEFNKLNYEPFDILLLTDYPKSSKSEAAQKVIDDMAELCDYRPLLSFKTHFQSDKWKDANGQYKYTKWVKKGFTTAPVVPVQTATYVNIVCYAHPMFDDIDEGDTGEHSNYTFHNADDPNQLVYHMLSEGGYESVNGVKKGIQGFELAAADNFVTIGLVHYNATANTITHTEGDETHTHVKWTAGDEDRLLVAMAERQTNIEARMMLFSLNAGAQSLQTEGGRLVILKCLEYLLQTDPLRVADCRFTFDNGEGAQGSEKWENGEKPHDYQGTGYQGDGLWSTAANWGPDYNVVPGRNNDVRIAAPCTVDAVKTKVLVGDEEQLTDAYFPEVLSIHITENGSLTIPANSSLTARSTILRVDEDGNVYPTNVEDISLGSDAGGNASLILNNERGDTKAGVAMYSKAKADTDTYSEAASTWQYIGTPHSDVQNAVTNYYNSWLYQYDTENQGWAVIQNGGPLDPFRGYCITHPEQGHTYWMEGTLAATTNQDITIPAGKFVVVANSWTAPIQIHELTDDDMEGLTEKTIYFFNTGSDPEGDNGVTQNATGDARWAEDTYISVPIHAADYTGEDTNIPSMQGFYVVGGKTDGTLHLDYERHVRAPRTNTPSGPMHAPARRVAADNEPQVAKFLFRGKRYDDRLIILERPDFTRGYDSGWDGEQWGGNAAAPMSYVVAETRWDAVSAIPEYEGTIIGFRAGEDSEYTIHFDYDGMEDALYLLDTDTQIYTRVLKGNSYTFTCADKAAHSRFILTRKAPQIATGTDHINTGENAKAVKFIKDEKMFIFMNGVLYDGLGKMVVKH